jgi:MFS family permease
MHGFDDIAPSPADTSVPTGPWYTELTRYHWFVLFVAALGWLFDTMDQQLFVLARNPAMKELLASGGIPTSTENVTWYGGLATSVFMIGWATGGLGFGILGDRWGRAKVMLWTILIYSVCTGLSAFSVSVWDFAAYRFLTGLGVGGEFAVGVSLVAEVMPSRARPFALGLLQALSGVGNIAAALISISLGLLNQDEAHTVSNWRVMFAIGTLPALLAILIRSQLKEPEKWQSLSAEEQKKKLGSYTVMLGNPVWRKHALLGMLLGFSGVVGLWGIGFFAPDLTRGVFQKKFQSDDRAAGAAELDRNFIHLAASHPAALTKVARQPQPNDLLSPESADRDALKDATVVFAAIQSLSLEKPPADGTKYSSDEILTVLDRTETPLNLKNPKPIGQSEASYKRRAAYLTAANAEKVADPEAVLVKDAKRITDRAQKLGANLTLWAGITSVMLNLGAMLGISAFSYFTYYTGRRPAMALSYFLAMISTAIVFWYLREFSQIFWMMPMMGFCQLALFGGYAIYFPELFPTYLRSTGTSFCYNVGRFVAAAGPFTLGYLTSNVFSEANGYVDGFRIAAVTMCSVFLIGLVTIYFCPETKGKPLPE